MPIDFEQFDVDGTPACEACREQETAVILTAPNPVALFGNFQQAIARMRAEADAVTVTDDTSHANAVEMVAQAKQVAARIEATRRQAKAPYLEAGRAIDGFANPLVDAVKDIESGLIKKATPYLIEKKRQEDEARRQAEAEARRQREQAEAEARTRAEEQRKALEAAEAALAKAEHREPEPVTVVVDPVAVIAQPPIVPARTEIKTDSGTARLKTVTKFEVIDIQGLPVECFTARAADIIKAVSPWINAQIKAGRKDIPGVRVWEESEMKTTTRRA